MRKWINLLRQSPLYCAVLLVLMLGGALLLLLPKAGFSDLENRPLAAWTGHSPLSEGFDSAVETYLSDHFPGRSAFVQAHAASSALLGRTRQDGVLISRSGALIEEPVTAVTPTARAAADTLREVCETLRLPMTAVLIPTSAAVAADDLPFLYEAGDQQPVIGALYAAMPGIETLPAGLTASTQYYRTDHHLTAEGAYTVYTQLCSAWGLTPGDAPRTRIPGFRGSYYARIPSPFIAPEDFTADLPEGISLTLDGRAAPLLDESRLASRSKYSALLGETYGHAVLTGGTGPDRLLVISDSYANAIVPLLAQHFDRVDVIDPRYYAGVLTQTAQEADSTRILALFGLNIFSTNRGLTLLTVSEE